ncbi:hypothetical protein [Krasilnikovia sp. MM14-A1004]|uniref:hypothetical protein n=1 Tax=Krasilnikovia sp. MM14-A1004 TaxID=3373541 RepID=UPI00399CD49B
MDDMASTSRHGELLFLAESAYKFGVGPILVHAPELLAETVFDNRLWFHITAEVANGDQALHGAFLRRELYVDAAALPRSHSLWRASAR